MWAAIGLINSLTPPTQAAGRQKSGGGGAGFAILFAVVPQLFIHGRESLDTPGVGDVVQMTSPVGSLVHLWKDSAWNSQVAFWGWSFPSLLVAPIMQLAIAAWIVAAMSRRLKNSLDPLASKRRSYVTLAVVDLAIAGICYSQWQAGFSATKLVYGYGLAHIIVCLIMMFATVPRRASIISWIWKRNAKKPRVSELLTSDRAEMTLAAFVYGLIGLGVLMIGLVGPMALVSARSDISVEALAEISATTFLLVVALAMLHQLLVAGTSKGGHLMFILFVVVANILPPITAAALRLSAVGSSEAFTERVASLSPVALFASNMQRVASASQGAGWLMVLYASLGAISFLLLRRLLKREAATVHRKLRDMGLPSADAA
jgi:hypothetical protein